ncbi:putative Ig domain-containing protein, partial [Brevifollis gellanilyticus]|uniref:putative Ig domain-containing protein n=1 Tax=Brevifollis gellanilyticus TaxID=748831 RepID=UPI0015805C4A
AGLRSATLRLTSNDANENPFDLVLEATGVPPAPPKFTTQPQSQLVLLGSPADFAPVVTGDPVISYEWKKGTATLKQGIQPGFSIALTKLADVAAYTVLADNPVGPPVSSDPVYLGLITPNQGTQILKAGTTLTVKCTVTAPAAPGVKVKYSWRRVGDLLPLENGPLADNGPVVSGADKATLSISKIRAADAGAYTCLVTLDTPGNDPELTNGQVQLVVVDAASVISSIPLPASVSVSESLDKTITATHFPTSFTVTGLPKGLKMDSKTGQITGKPTEPSKKDKLGVYIPNKITFKATNVWGTGPGVDFYMTIEALDPSVVGTFHGIVARSAHSNFGLGGHAQITVSSTGAVSGSATLAGQKHTLAGALDSSLGDGPTANLTIKRTPATLGDLQFVMSIVTGENLLQGRIIDPGFEQTTSEIALGDSSAPGLVNGSAEEARFNTPGGIAILPGGSAYVSDTGNHVIRFISSPADSVASFAGSSSPGFIDGNGTAARFKNPEGLALDGAGNLFVADTGNATIRRITPGGAVVTMAGFAGQTGSTNGIGSEVRFVAPCALCFDPAGNLYIVDRGSHLIRKMTPAGVVSTLAGKAGVFGHKDGSGVSALFKSPRGITYDPVLKALFVTDTQNRVIRKVTLTGAVTTYAGSPGVEAYADGLLANARFVKPLGILSLGNGTLVVGDSRLVQIHVSGVAAAISELLDTESSLDHPVALGFDASRGTLMAVHDRLHVLTRHESDEPLQNARIDARRSTWTTTNLVLPAQQGLFNAVLETTAPSDDTTFPSGDGYVQASISKNGVATWAGKAADGSTLTFGTFMSSDRKIPLHVSLYQNTGSLQGETFITTPDLDLIRHSTPALDWYKIPQSLISKDRSYKSGFPLHALELYGGKHVPNHLHTCLGLTNSPATLGLGFTASLISGFTQNFTLTSPNAVAVSANTRSFDLKMDPKTGVFTGSFKEGSPAATVPFSGVLIRYAAGENLREGRGHYLVPASTSSTAPVQSARVRLGTPP